MGSDQLGPEEVVSVLHDHYKDTFSHIRDRERQRDRLFLLLIALYGVLTFQVQYPANLTTAVKQITVAGVGIETAALPMAALLDATWLLALLTALKYCQTTVTVERQYPYLHRLEQEISGRLGDPDVFSREGKTYLRQYPLLLNWAWFCYVVIFPLSVLLATVTLMTTVWLRLAYSLPHKLFTTTMAVALVLAFALYQVIPNFQGAWRRARQRPSGNRPG